MPQFGFKNLLIWDPAPEKHAVFFLSFRAICPFFHKFCKNGLPNGGKSELKAQIQEMCQPTVCADVLPLHFAFIRQRQYRAAEREGKKCLTTKVQNAHKELYKIWKMTLSEIDWTYLTSTAKNVTGQYGCLLASSTSNKYIL